MKVKHVGEPHGWKITPQNEGFRWVNPMGGDVYKALAKSWGIATNDLHLQLAEWSREDFWAAHQQIQLQKI